ncbi:hypothetical protein [Micromonospora sp. DT47]|uniref:hypothetical protein n=1 Tax=Micromonospora sp. DT47 TaxID=3393431 RepID=UPI003CF55F72
MSRTDAHRPGWVRERDPMLRQEYRVDHNHWLYEHWDPELRRHLVKRLIPCDLRECLSAPRTYWTRCALTYIGGRGQCPCNSCSGRVYRKQARRQERHGWRAKRRQMLAEHRGGNRDLDVPPIRGKAW